MEAHGLHGVGAYLPISSAYAHGPHSRPRVHVHDPRTSHGNVHVHVDGSACEYDSHPLRACECDYVHVYADANLS